MEIIAFLLGVGSVIAIAMVVSMFRINKRIANSEQLLNEQEKQFDNIYREFENVNNMINQHVDEIYRTLDSRFDKFENKLNNKK